jgi:hypothetical protein
MKTQQCILCIVGVQVECCTRLLLLWILCGRQQYSAPRSWCRVVDIFARFQPNSVFLDTLTWKSPISNFADIRPVSTEMVRAEIQKDGHGEANRRFCNYAKAPKNYRKREYRVIEISLCTWWLQYRKLQSQSYCLAADRQGHRDNRLTLTPSVIPNSNYGIMVSDWNC